MIEKLQERELLYLMILAMLLWGGGWSALKILTQTMPMQSIVFWRFFIMSLAFIPFLYYFKLSLKIPKSSIKYLLASSVLNIAFMLFSFLGVKHGYAGAGSVIITTFSPIMTFLVAALLFRKNLSALHYIGLFLGLLGGYILLELDNLSLFLNGSNGYFLLCALIWAGVTLLAQHSQQHIHPILYSFVISLIASFVSFFFAYDSNLLAIFEQDLKFWIALLYLAILGQTVATTIFFIASGRLGSQKTSSFMFLVPLFSLIIAWIVLDEPMQLHIVIGGLISMLAIYFINKKSN